MSELALPVYLLVLLVAGYLLAFASLGVGAAAVASRQTTTKNVKYTQDMSSFQNLTVNGNLQVDETGLFQQQISAKGNLAVTDSASVPDVAVVGTSVSVDGASWTEQQIQLLKAQTEWFTVELTQPAMNFVKTFNPAPTNPLTFPFGSFLDSEFVGSAGTASQEYVRLKDSPDQPDRDNPHYGTFATFSNVHEPSTWLLEGSFAVSWNGSTIPDGFSASLTVFDERLSVVDPTSGLPTCVYLGWTSHPTEDGWISTSNQEYSLPPAVLQFPMRLPSGSNKNATNVGLVLDMFFSEVPPLTVNVSVTSYRFSFRRLL
jgi:hypothetical protein